MFLENRAHQSPTSSIKVQDELKLHFSMVLEGYGGRLISTETIVKFTQLCSKFPPTALLNFARDG